MFIKESVGIRFLIIIMMMMMMIIIIIIIIITLLSLLFFNQIQDSYVSIVLVRWLFQLDWT